MGDEFVEQLARQGTLLTRRTFLGVVGLVSLAGCSNASSVNGLKASERGAQNLLNSASFFIAHRGSGDNWTEHTMHAYREAVAHGASAVELSVQRTADGHFVCHHDSSLERLCGKDVLIENLTLAELAEYRNDARLWLGPYTPSEPIPRLSQVLEELAGKAILFIEDKTGKNTVELIQALKDSPVGEESVVWKMEATGASHRAAAEANYLTWGYFAPQNFDQIEKLAGEFDAIGIHDSADELVIGRAVSTGKPVIVWEVHTRSQMQSLRAQGVAGMMCSNFPYVTGTPVELADSHDTFASGRRDAGDLPDVLTWKSQPQFLPEQGALRLAGRRKASYVLGSMASLRQGGWVLEAQIRWPTIGDERQIAGLSFGTPNDTPYRAFEKSQRSGFHLQLESSGEASIWQARDNGQKALGRRGQLTFVANQWIPLRITATDTRLNVDVAGQGTLSAEISGPVAAGYLNLLTLHPAGMAVDFKEIRLQQLGA